MTQTSYSDFIRLNGTLPLSCWRLGDHALGDLPQHRGLDEAGVDAVGVGLGLAQVEVVDVPGEGVLLVQREQPILQRSLDGGLPGLDQQHSLVALAQV